MKKTKLIITVLVICLVLPIVASCNGGGSGSEGEPVELVIYSQLANYSGELVGWSQEIFLEEFNAKITIINDSIAGTFQTRMEAGFLGDIVLFGSDGREYREASRAGLLFDWLEDDLLWEYGPDIAEYFMPALNKNRAITGTLHGFGHDIAGSAADNQLFFYYPQVRYDLYTQLGSPVIETFEDFIPVIADMVALEPVTSAGTKTYGVSSFIDWDGDMVMMVKATAALYGWDEFGFGLYHAVTQEYQDCLAEGGWYLRCLKFYNTLNQMGLYDPDSMTQNWNQFSEKAKNGAFVWNPFEWMVTPFNTDDNKAQGKAFMPVVAQDQKNIVYGLSIYGGTRLWAIGANTTYPELCMEIINWFSTPEGVLTYNYGPKGLTWDYDESGEPYLTELGVQTRVNPDTTVSYGNYEGTYKNGEFQHNNTTWSVDAINPDSPTGQTFNYRTWPSYLSTAPVYPIEQQWREWTGYNQPDEWFEDMGMKSLATASAYSPTTKSRELEMTWEQVKMCIRDGSWKAIYAASDAEYDAIVAQMIADAKEYGYDECVEWQRQEALLRKAAEDEAVAAAGG